MQDVGASPNSHCAETQNPPNRPDTDTEVTAVTETAPVPEAHASKAETIPHAADTKGEDRASCAEQSEAPIDKPTDTAAAAAASEIEQQVETTDQQEASAHQESGSGVCPLCLGIMQSLDCGDFGASAAAASIRAIALPDTDAAGGKWHLCDDSSPARLASAIK